MMLWERRPQHIRPHWWMGHAYYDYERGQQVMAVVPLNFLWRAWRRIEHWWLSSVCCGRSWVDEEVQRLRDKSTH